jgi:hypothetical protein
MKFPAVNFFQILVIKPRIRIRDPEPESGSPIRKKAGFGSVSGSALNQCGSATLSISRVVYAICMPIHNICIDQDPAFQESLDPALGLVSRLLNAKFSLILK